MPESNPSKRVTELAYAIQIDGLRAIAVISVCFHHWTAFGHQMQLGLFGVQLFFVISGFLITGILLNLRQATETGAQSVCYSARQFYLRRFLRIFPLYYFCLFALFVIGKFGIRETFPWHLFYVSNVYFFLAGQFGGNLSHFWSLAVEEQFYLIWPWLILLAPTAGWKIPSMIGVMILLGPLSRGLLWALGYDNFAQWNSLLFANLDTLGLGALLAWWRFSGAETSQNFNRLRWAALGATAVVVLLQFAPESAAFAIFHRFALGIAGSFLVLGAARSFPGVAGSILAWKPFVYLGRISYGIYVIHMFAPDIVGKLFTIVGLPHSSYKTPGGIVLMFLSTFCLAAASWHFFEYPINCAKKRFPYVRGKTRIPTQIGVLPNKGASA